MVVVGGGGVKISYDILTHHHHHHPCMIFWPLGQVLVVQKLKALALLKQEIIHDVNILIDLIKQIWAINKTIWYFDPWVELG